MLLDSSVVKTHIIGPDFKQHTSQILLNKKAFAKANKAHFVLDPEKASTVLIDGIMIHPWSTIEHSSKIETLINSGHLITLESYLNKYN